MSQGIILEKISADELLEYSRPSKRNFVAFLDRHGKTLNAFTAFLADHELSNCRLSGSTITRHFNRSSDIDLIKSDEEEAPGIRILDFDGIRVDLETYSSREIDRISNDVQLSCNLAVRPLEIDWSLLKYFRSFHFSLQLPDMMRAEPAPDLDRLALFLARRRHAKAESLLQDAIGGFVDGDYDFAISRGRTALDESIDCLVAALGDHDVQRKRRLDKVRLISVARFDLQAEYHHICSSWPQVKSLQKEVCQDIIRLAKLLQATAHLKIDRSPHAYYD